MRLADNRAILRKARMSIQMLNNISIMHLSRRLKLKRQLTKKRRRIWQPEQVMIFAIETNSVI